MLHSPAPVFPVIRYVSPTIFRIITQSETSGKRWTPTTGQNSTRQGGKPCRGRGIPGGRQKEMTILPPLSLIPTPPESCTRNPSIPAVEFHAALGSRRG